MRTRTFGTTVLVAAAALMSGCDGGPGTPAPAGHPGQAQAPANKPPAADSTTPPPSSPLAVPPLAPLAPVETGPVTPKPRPNFVLAPTARDGVDIETIAPAELIRTSRDVNPFQSEARLVFQLPAPSSAAPASPVAVHLSVKVHDSVELAQAWLQATSKTVAGKLTPAVEPMPCDQGFVATDADGGLVYALLCRANVTCVGRVVGTGSESSDQALRTTLASWAKAVDASAELDARAVPSRPRVGTIGSADVARSGHPAALTVPVDPSGPQADFFAYEASDGASVVASKLGPMLYASKPGLVKVRVAASTRRLGSTVVEATIQVGGD